MRCTVWTHVEGSWLECPMNHEVRAERTCDDRAYIDGVCASVVAEFICRVAGGFLTEANRKTTMNLPKD